MDLLFFFVCVYYCKIILYILCLLLVFCGGGHCLLYLLGENASAKYKSARKTNCEMALWYDPSLSLSLLDKQDGGTLWMQSLPEFIYWPTSSSNPPHPAFIKYAFQIQAPGLTLPPHKSYTVYFMTRPVRIVIKTSQYRFMVLCNLDGKVGVIFTVGDWFWASCRRNATCT